MAERGLRVKRVLAELNHKFSPELYKEEAKQRHKRINNDPVSKSYWSATFHELYVSSTDKPQDSTRDDLLFYIKYDTKTKKEEVVVVRCDTKAIPEGDDPDVLWDETLYINLLLQEFKYCLTCCTLAAGSSSSIPLSSRIMQKVEIDIYPTHIERRMDMKEEESGASYPNLNFTIDSFQELFGHLALHVPGEKIAVQITASNPYLAGRRPIFIGGLDYKILRSSCDQKDEERKESASLFQTLFRRKSTKGLNKFHYIPMEGPNGKGHAEMAICSMEAISDTETSEVAGTESDGRPLSPEEREASNSPTDKVHSSSQNLLDYEDDPKTKQSSTKKKGKRYLSKDGAPIHTYLTFVQLPWYSMIEDILRSHKEPVL